MFNSCKKLFLINLVFIFSVFLMGFSIADEEDGALFSKEVIENGWFFETDKMQVKITAVAHNIFRITAIPQSKDWPAGQGTFVVPVSCPPITLKRFDAEDKFGISTKSATLEILKDSLEICLIRKDGEVKLKKGKLVWHPENPLCWKAEFLAPLNERNYGIGNPQMGRSGGLMKSFAQATVGNGITQIPFIWSTAGYGILIDFEKKGAAWRKISGAHCWRVPDKTLDLYLILGESPYEILGAYTDLTGKPPIPPIWAFGFMISRWGYSSWEDIREKWYTFRKKKIPVDVFIYDYDWFIKDWRWNNKFFPSPKENLKEALNLGIKVVGIRKPRMDDKENFEFAKSHNWILPETKNDLNFSIPEVRKWWWEKHIPVFEDGMAGWWNDEAEQTMTEYFYMVKSQWNGMLIQKPNERVWTINRAFSPGLQRLGTSVWTGDIFSTWRDLRNQPGTLLNYSMCGMPYGSQDIGGFVGKPSPEMYVRWIQQGVFVPVMRAHSQQYSDRWPWAFGSEAEDAVKEAIELRYRLIPFLYSYAREANQTGAPLMRPLFFEFPDDSQTFDMEDEWFVGREILVAPILKARGKRRVYLPAETWYEFNTAKPIEGPAILSIKAALNEIPIYVREGSILPLGPVMQHTGEKNKIPLDIHVYPGKDTEFFLYHDDGKTYTYEEGCYRMTLLKWEQTSFSFTAEPLVKAYNGPRIYVADKIYINNTVKPEKIVLNGKNLPELKDALSEEVGWFYNPENKQLKVITGNLSLNNPIKLELAPEINQLLAKGNLKKLINLLDKRKGEQKHIIFGALMEVGGEEAYTAVKTEALKGDCEANRKTAVDVISDYGIGEVSFFEKCLKDKSSVVQIAAVRALHKLKAGADYFIELSDDTDEKVRFASENVLGILASQKNQDAISFLVRRLKEEESLYLKLRIIKALAPCCNEKQVFSEFKYLLETPNPFIQQTVLQILKGYYKEEDYFNLFMSLAFDKNERTAVLAQDILNSYPEGQFRKYFGQPIRQWKVIGPFDNTNGKGFAKVYSPEKGMDAGGSCEGLGGKVFWRNACANNAGVVNLLAAFPQHPENVCAYGWVIIESQEEMDVQLWMGSDDDIRVWLNGELVWSKKIGRALRKDEDKTRIKLKKGKNSLLLKICQGMGAWGYTARLVDPDGKLNKTSYLKE